jgi:putative endonuclease
MYYVYMIRCDDGSHYTGLAKDVRRRMREHYYKSAQCAKYTRCRNVVSLDALWHAENRIEAAKLEYAIKKLTKPEKLDLIAHPEKLGTSYAANLTECTYCHDDSITLEMCLESNN